MNKTDFLASLRSYLNGRIDPYEVESNMEYYSAYIDGELAKGRSEEEVMEELGQPSLIARTLIDSVKRREGEDIGGYSYEQDFSDEEKGDFWDDEPSDDYTGTRESSAEGETVRKSGSSSWKIFAVIGLILLILLIIVIGAGILFFRLSWAILRYLWPVILIIIILAVIARVSRK